MFQRKQSLLLLISFVITLVALFINVGQINDAVITAFGSEADGLTLPAWGFGVLLIIQLVLLLFTLLKFNERPKQMMLASLTNLVGVLAILYLFGNFYLNEISLNFLVLIIVLNPVFITIARKLIKKDEDLVKSVDRIR